jgi:phosphoribosylanthranilate isomerase
MPLTVKICGLNSPDAVEAAVAAGADLFGFVFFGASPRHVEPGTAGKLASLLPDRARAVALTVNAEDRLIDEIVEAVSPGLIQMHGRETPARVGKVAARTGMRVIKALPVAALADLAAAAAYEQAAQMLLFDARPPEDASRPGGHGRPFDWRLMRAYRGPVPWLLSGGLDAGNVGRAIGASGARGIDVSSGVESAPGVKQPRLIGEFVAAARAAESQLEESA